MTLLAKYGYNEPFIHEKKKKRTDDKFLNLNRSVLTG